MSTLIPKVGSSTYFHRVVVSIRALLIRIRKHSGITFVSCRSPWVREWKVDAH